MVAVSQNDSPLSIIFTHSTLPSVLLILERASLIFLFKKCSGKIKKSAEGGRLENISTHTNIYVEVLFFGSIRKTTLVNCQLSMFVKGLLSTDWVVV